MTATTATTGTTALTPAVGIAQTTVVVLAKDPVPGRVKTRLQTRFTPVEAARLARAAIDDTFAAVRAAGPARVIAAWDGTGTDAVPPDVEVTAQVDGGLDARIEAALAHAFAGADGPVLLVGMDTPQLTAADLEIDWMSTDAVLGLTPDGGYWVIGLRSFVAGCVLGVPMSTDHTGADQLDRLHSLGLRVSLLGELDDVDTPADAALVAQQAPELSFARAYRCLVSS
jgi:glycosyltransferase A (GT-A) superfamily protein (DUF2064 family)